MTNRYNLIDEDWIPVSNMGKVSLRRIFSDTSLSSLGGTPVQKLSLLKLLLAIAQTAYTPQDDTDWANMEAVGLGQKCVDYLEKHKDCFWLYGDKPFLQMPVLKTVKDKKGEALPVSEIGGSFLPDLPSENNTLLFQNQISRPLTDAEKAVFIVSVMNYSPGGKRTVKNVEPLSKGYAGKSNSAKASPSLGTYVGYLNSCLWGENLLDTVWLNLFTKDRFSKFPNWTKKEIIPPWEQMPTGENDDIALHIKDSMMGVLCAMSRFVLLEGDGIIYMEGLQYPSHVKGWREPFISCSTEGKMLWLDTSKKPWRNLTSLIHTSFGGSNSSYDCPQISQFLLRARANRDIVGIWSGGLQVRGTAGDQSVKQTDDFIESLVFLDSKTIGDSWFIALRHELDEMENLSKIVYSSVLNYYKNLNSTKDDIAKRATELFWQLCERKFQNLIDVCDRPYEVYELKKKFAGYATQSYNQYCHKKTARQMIAWANNKPKLGKYLSKAREVE